MLAKIQKFCRFVLVTIVVLAVVLPMAMYIMLSTDWAQSKLKDFGERKLSELLGTDVSIGEIEYIPFCTLRAGDVSVNDDFGSKALTVGTLDGRFELWDFLFRGRIIIDYATLTDLDLKLYRETPSSPLNIQGIIDKLSKKDPNKPPTRFNVRLNDLVLDGCKVSYHVLSEPATPGRFNVSHLALTDVNAELCAPVISNDEYSAVIRSLSLKEASGFTLSRLSCRAKVTRQQISVLGLNVSLPASHLSLADLILPIDGFDDVRNLAVNTPVSVRVLQGSHISLPDIAAFVPVMKSLDYDIAVEADITGTRERVKVALLRIGDTGGIVNVDLHGAVDGLSNLKEAAFHDLEFAVSTDRNIPRLLGAVAGGHISPRVMDLVTQAGDIDIQGKFEGRLLQADVDIDMASRLARASVAGKYAVAPDMRSIDLAVKADVDSLRLGTILDKPDFNSLSAAMSVDGVLGSGSFVGDVDATVRRFDFRGYRYRDIKASAEISPERVDANIASDDPNAKCRIDGTLARNGEGFTTRVSADIDYLRLDTLGITRNLGYTLASNIRLDASGYSINNIKGDLDLSDTRITNRAGRTLSIKELSLDVDNLDDRGHLWLESDYLEANIDGSLNFTTIGRNLSSMVWKVLPALAPEDWHGAIDEGVEENPLSVKSNEFSFDLSARNLDQLCEFFEISTNTPSRLEITGNVDDNNQTAYLTFDMPRLRQGQGSGRIRNTVATLSLDGNDGTAQLYGTSTIPTKKGEMEIVALVSGQNGSLNTFIDWDIDRAKAINGEIKFLTSFSRDDQDRLGVLVNFEPGKINFGNEVWNINPSTISYMAGNVMVDNFSLSTADQSITVNGVAGSNPSDLLTVDLNSIQLIEIFETLDIDNAMIGGFATGRVFATGLLGPAPDIKCDGMHIADIGYNRCTLGDALVNLRLDDQGQVFRFDADVTTPEDRHSSLKGSIVIPKEELRLNIEADRVKVGFMKPFMAAFTSDIEGFASGHATLSGTFKDLDMQGRIYAEDVKMKVDFTNTWYHATDSVIIEPGRINLDNITLRDEKGDTALLNGYVTHRYFHDAAFRFDITDAHNFLCYDMTEKLSNRWFGTIYGDGGATVSGKPGIVDISVNMTTAPNSTFTFVLTDKEEASEYSFISFRDVTQRPEIDPIYTQYVYAEDNPDLYNEQDREEQSTPTAYKINIEMDVTPQAELVIVMDPAGKDKITAHGSGHMRMEYGSANNDFKLFGRYTLDRGNYLFTLQDIIIKEFGIKPGSSITFSGDPYQANLDIDAYYTLKANLSDLDESFLQDHDIANTLVQVRTLLNVTGNILQPNIKLDLEFPTLKSDGQRKVMSIISTEDMINRQILYLLALGRFYTPEYMASTTKGNELFSVASSTIASQLSSMLGKLSDNWSIAPNLRSDRGDFSDIEVDLSLSSSLLNNRLLFNGNFGYRDNALNSNQFIGDFDIEYLLTPSGTWRLKAYNRYNDQNYYLRTAQTTQGIGLMYRRDFDNLFGLRRRYPSLQSPDSVKVVQDSITILPPQ